MFAVLRRQLYAEAENGSVDGWWCERGDSNPHGFTRQILSLRKNYHIANVYATAGHHLDYAVTILSL